MKFQQEIKGNEPNTFHNVPVHVSERLRRLKSLGFSINHFGILSAFGIDGRKDGGMERQRERWTKGRTARGMGGGRGRRMKGRKKVWKDERRDRRRNRNMDGPFRGLIQIEGRIREGGGGHPSVGSKAEGRRD